MKELFLNVLNMSIAANWLVLAVLLIRLLFQKAPKWVNVLLWGIVAIRLICPFSIESTLSLIPSVKTLPDDVISGPSFDVHTGIDAVDTPINDYLGDRYFEGVSVPTDYGANMVETLAVIWMLGVIFLIAYTAFSYLRIRRTVETAVIYRDNIFQSENISTPFVLGIIKPRIYLPYKLGGQSLSHVIAHENAHITRRDHLWKPLGFLILTIHWFNPLMWVSYVLLCRDIELACDEKVIKELNSQQRADYSQALVSCSVNRRQISACPLAFGEVGVKDRVMSVMNYKKPAFFIIVLAVIICMIVAVCFLTNPKGPSIYGVFSSDQYRLLEQKQVTFTLEVDKDKLPESICTKEGHEFKPHEVVAYSTDPTEIYLKKVMVSNESDDLLYFAFDFTYDLEDSGSFLSPFTYMDGLDNTVSTLYPASEELRDYKTTYPEAVRLRGHGPGTQFMFYVSKEACMAAEDAIFIDVVCNQITYEEYKHKKNDLLHGGLNAEIIEIDPANHILYVCDLDENAGVFGERCALYCTDAIRDFNLFYVNYDAEDDVRTIEFDDFKVGDAVIISLYDSEKQNARNESAAAVQVQLATQRLNDV